MTLIQQNGSVLGAENHLSRVKRPISQRKLEANRANAKCSTGPRTEAGKSTSRRNALKHGILSRSVKLASITPSLDLHPLKLEASPLFENRLNDSTLQEVERIWEKMARVLAFEKECVQYQDRFEQNERLIYRYERMLSRQLHQLIHESSLSNRMSRNRIGRSL